MCVLYLNKTEFNQPVEAVNFTSSWALDLPVFHSQKLPAALAASRPGCRHPWGSVCSRLVNAQGTRRFYRVQCKTAIKMSPDVHFDDKIEGFWNRRQNPVQEHSNAEGILNLAAALSSFVEGRRRGWHLWFPWQFSPTDRFAPVTLNSFCLYIIHTF